MTERAQALEAAVRALIEPMCERVTDNGIVRQKMLVVAGDDAFDRYRRVVELLAVQPPPPVGSPTTDTRQDCTCLGTCRGAEGLGPRWKCALEKSTPVEPAGASEPPSALMGQTLITRLYAPNQPSAVSPVEPTPNDTLLRNIRMAAAMGLSFGHQATPQPMERMVERKDKRLRQILTLLAEHGVTGSMLRAESNAPVEPTPEPPIETECCHAPTAADERFCRKCGHEARIQPTGAPAPCVWRDAPGGAHVYAACTPNDPYPFLKDEARQFSVCPYCAKSMRFGHPLTVER